MVLVLIHARLDYCNSILYNVQCIYQFVPKPKWFMADAEILHYKSELDFVLKKLCLPLLFLTVMLIMFIL